MKRLTFLVARCVPLLLVLLAVAPVALAAEPDGRSTGAMMAFDEDVSVPPEQTTDLVLVIDGTATIAGEARTVVAIGGAAVLDGATVETIVAIDSRVDVGAGSTVTGDIATLDAASVAVATGGTVAGDVRDLAPQLVGIGAVLAPAIALVVLGFLAVTWVAGLALAALAARQVRTAEHLISREPGTVLVAGLAGVVLPIVGIGLLFVTVVGIPLGMALLVAVWPAVAYLGYLLAAIWIGDWVLARMTPDQPRERPYLAVTLGLLILMVASIVPLVTAIASLFGMGAVLLLAWRVFRGTPGTAAPTVPGVTPAPMPS